MRSARPTSGASSMEPSRRTISTWMPRSEKYCSVSARVLGRHAHPRPLGGIVALPQLARLGDHQAAEAEAEVERLVHVGLLLEQDVLAHDAEVGGAVRHVGGTSAGLRRMKRSPRASSVKISRRESGVDAVDAELAQQGQRRVEQAALGQREREPRLHGSRSMRGAERAQLRLEPLVAAVEVIDARDLGAPARGQARPAPARPRRAGRWPSPARPGRRGTPRTTAVEPSVSMRAPMRASSAACMKRFSKIVSVILRLAVGQPEQRHELRLHVGGEARERARDHVGRAAAAPGPGTRTRSPSTVDRGAALLQLGEHAARWRGHERR